MGINLKKYRKSKGYTNAELCYMARISQSTLSRMENGKPVSRVSARRACEALGISLENVDGIVFTQ